MFEYIDSGTIFIYALLGVLLFLVVIIEKARSVGTIFLFILWIVFIFYFIYDTNKTVNNNITQFKAGDNLICHSGFDITYNVSLKDNWKLKDHYFIRDSLMLKINRCEVK